MGYRTNERSKHLLTGEEEIVLGRMVQAGMSATAKLSTGERIDSVEKRRLRVAAREGEKAIHEFVERNMRLAMNVAAKYAKAQPNMEYEDLIQESNIGLIRAVEKFDPSRGYKFSTYATWWCRQACQRAVANQSRSIRLPMHVEADVRKLQRAMEKLESFTGVMPSAAEAAEELGWDTAHCSNLLMYLDVTRVSSLDDPISEDSAIHRRDAVQDADAVPVDELGIQSQRGLEIRDAIEFLNDREREILYMRYGIGEYAEPMTLQQIGERLQFTREHIRQLEAKAVSKLRHPSSGLVETFV